MSRVSENGKTFGRAGLFGQLTSARPTSVASDEGEHVLEVPGLAVVQHLQPLRLLLLLDLLVLNDLGQRLGRSQPLAEDGRVEGEGCGLSPAAFDTPDRTSEAADGGHTKPKD